MQGRRRHVGGIAIALAVLVAGSARVGLRGWRELAGAGSGTVVSHFGGLLVTEERYSEREEKSEESQRLGESTARKTVSLAEAETPL
jgi:hypothetical protein